MIIYVIVAVHNRWNFTQQFLQSIDAQVLPANATIHTLVVDDGSTDETAMRLRQRSDTTVITGDGSWWWAGSMDKALRWVRTRMRPGDFVYLGNNDTVLDPDHLQVLVEAANERGCDLVGSISFEIWPTGEHHPVSGAFRIDPVNLEVANIPSDELGRVPIDALAGRGLLLSSRAIQALRFHPRFMPQHFADLAATAALISAGHHACIATMATSTQLERAGSSVEFKPSLSQLFARKSQLYVPALVTFWIRRSPRRFPLLWRMPMRAVREIRRGSYSVR